MGQSRFIEWTSQLHDSVLGNPNHLHFLNKFTSYWRLFSRAKADIINCTPSDTLLDSELQFLCILRFKKMNDLRFWIYPKQWFIVRLKVLHFRSWISIPTGTTTAQSSTGTTTQQISTLSSIGITVGVSVVLSTFSISSIIIVWMIFNQMRILILMLLTEAYFPSPVNNYLVGLKMFSFNFSFMFIQNIPWLQNWLKEFNFSQPSAMLQDIGLVSQSSLINNINLLLILILIVLSHIT